MMLKAFEIWKLHAFIVFIAITVISSVYIHRRYSFMAAITSAYFFLSGIVVVYGPIIFYGKFQRQINDGIKTTLFSGLLCVGLVTALNSKHFSLLIDTVKNIMVLNTMLLWFYVCGIFNAGSMDLTVSAMVLPFIVNDYLQTKERIHLAKILIIIGTIIYWGATTPFVILAGSMMAWAFVSKEVNIKKRYYLYAVLLALAVGIWRAGPEFFYTANRFHVWHKVMGIFFDSFYTSVGAGTGSYKWLGPVLQAEKEDVLLFMHNEYLQILFENGFIGLILVGSLILTCIYNIKDKPYLVASFAAMMLASMVQFPLRIELSFIWCLCLIRIGLTKGKLE